jgi:hypothetical protein
MFVLDIGTLAPTHAKFGQVRKLFATGSSPITKDTIPLIDSLGRPVSFTKADLNQDGKPDLVVCEFGYLTGALSWMENKGNGYERHVLRNEPGAVKAYVRDENNDQLPDIWALFSQGEEGIFLFTNQGNGQFTTQQVLRFPPSYGSSYFEFQDFDKDGHEDIIYTCGDNGDYSTVLKPYHGVYIFLNDGNNTFRQRFFYPINGCYKALARDYDKDGDMDIATVSFFADFKNRPEEGFVYLENEGNFNFQAATFPEARQGRWITMDAGDLDGDGKIDIVLGNFSLGPTTLKSDHDWKKGPPFIVLKNVGK